MPIFALIKTVLGIYLHFLKRRDPKSKTEWKNDLKGMDKALASGDDDLITLAFERMRRQSGHHRSGEDS